MNSKGMEKFDKIPSDQFRLDFGFANGNYDVREQGRIDTSSYQNIC
jgi:hypothetical protein